MLVLKFYSDAHRIRDVVARLAVRLIREAGHPLTSYQLGKHILPAIEHLHTSTTLSPEARICVLKVTLSKLTTEDEGVLVNCKGLGYWPVGYPPFKPESVKVWYTPKPTLERLELEVLHAFSAQCDEVLRLGAIVARLQARGVKLSDRSYNLLTRLLNSNPLFQREPNCPRESYRYLPPKPQQKQVLSA